MEPIVLKIFVALIFFLSDNVLAEEGDLPKCKDLWTGMIPDSLKEIRQECFMKALDNNEDLANEYIGWIREIISFNSTEQWKVDILKNYKAKCLSLIENKKFNEAEICGKDILKGYCKL